MLRGDSTNKDHDRSIQRTLQDKISMAACCTGDKTDIEQSIAIVASNGSLKLSFLELWSAAGYIAHKLKTKCGVQQPNDRIGILIPNGSVTTSYILAMMAVLYCGGVYVPIAVSSTKSGNVVESLLNMAGCVAVIDLRSCEDSISAHTDNDPYHDLGWGGPCLRLEPLVFLLDQIKAESSSSSSTTITERTYPYQNVFHEGSSHDEACLLFTSGSTGTPKGVILTHKGILCRINWSARTYPMIHEEDTILCHLAATTLGGTMLPLTGLTQGCSIFIAPPEVLIDTNQFAKMLVLHRVNTLITMPSLLKNLLKIKDGQAMRNMKTIYLTGEAYDDMTLRNVAVASPKATLINLYGMTETTGHTVAYTYDRACGEENMRAYMGLPTHNTTAIMIDPETEADSGIPRNSVGDISIKTNESMGELCVSGIGLSKGYVDEKLNKDKFFYHDGMKFFRTGDTVELVTDASNDKTLRYVGRADRCVKVNGFRVELDGVESGLCKVDGVTFAAAIMTKKHGYEHQSTLQIVGFVSPGTLDGSIVRDRCFTFLPKHEVPLKVYALDSLPLTITGKIDRKALEDMVADQGQRKTVVGETSLTNIGRDEYSIVERIMNECKRHIDIHDPDMSIFDAGATSVTVVALLYDLQPLPLSASTIYEYKSPTKIASKVMKDVADGTSELMDDSGMAGSYMLSHAGRMGLGKGFSFPGIFFFMAYFLNLALVYLRSQNTTIMLNMSISFHSEVDVEKLKAALASAMHAFPTLRSRFQKTYSSMLPIFGQFLYDIEDTVSILEHSDSSIPFKIISNGATWYKHERRGVIRRISKGDESLVEFILVQGQTLHIYCDHIICDFTSLVMLSKFIIGHYNGDCVSGETRRYKDFPEWQHGLKIDTSKDSLIRSTTTATPHYGIPKRLTNFMPFSVRCQELFLQPIPIKHCVPDDVRNIRIVFLTLWHSVLMDHGGPSNIAVTESIDLRHSSFLNGFERTFGYIAHAPVVSNLKFSSSKSLVANMQDLQKDLGRQKDEMSLWSKAHGPDTTVLSEGWHFNFIGTRNIPKLKGATIHPRGFIPRRTNILQRHPTIQVEVFYNDTDLMFQINYCVMRMSGQTIRAIGDDLVERFHAFRSS